MRKVILFILLFGTSGCTVKTLYNQLDWLIADHLQSYVELSDEQQHSLRLHIEQSLLWHKSSQLPLYVEWLTKFRADVISQPEAAVLEQDLEQLQTFVRNLRIHAADELSVLLPSLSAKQRRELYAGMEKKNSEFADRFINISREQQLEQYIERTRDRFDEWLGSLTTEQEAMIRASAIDIKSVAGEVLKTRRRWQQEFIRILDGQDQVVTTKQALRELFANLDRLRSKDYQQDAHHNQQIFIGLIISVANSMSKDQRDYFSAKVANYSRYFMELAEEARDELKMN